MLANDIVVFLAVRSGEYQRRCENRLQRFRHPTWCLRTPLSACLTENRTTLLRPTNGGDEVAFRRTAV